MLARRYSQNTRRSLSGASTLYQDTARPERRAKPAAKTVLPVPARPLIMFALYEARLFSSSFSRRGRGTRPRLSRNCDLFVDEVTFVFFYEHCDGVNSSESVQGFLLPYVSHLGTIQIVP